MKTLLAAVAISSLASTMPLLHPAPVAAAHAYSVSVNIHPNDSTYNPYQLLAPQNRRTAAEHVCEVSITDLVTAATFSGPKILLLPADRQTKESVSGGYVVAVTASLSRDSRHATWDVTLRKDGKVLTRQTSDTQLQPRD